MDFFLAEIQLRPLIRTMASLYKNSQLTGSPVITIPVHVKNTDSSACWAKLGTCLKCAHNFKPREDRCAYNAPLVTIDLASLASPCSNMFDKFIKNQNHWNWR